MFDTKATVMRMQSAPTDQTHYSWQPVRTVWVHGEQTGRASIFSKNGIGTAGTLFTLYRMGDITLGDALLWRGCHYFLTAAEQKTPVEAQIAAAKVQICICTATRPKKQKDTGGRVKNIQMPLAVFPAVLTEKYLGSTKEAPQVVNEAAMVLITHKTILLREGDLVTIQQVSYIVLICHLLGEWENEYEIINTSEA